jgi:hypothetical protein
MAWKSFSAAHVNARREWANVRRGGSFQPRMSMRGANGPTSVAVGPFQPRMSMRGISDERRCRFRIVTIYR